MEFDQEVFGIIPFVNHVGISKWYDDALLLKIEHLKNLLLPHKND